MATCKWARSGYGLACPLTSTSGAGAAASIPVDGTAVGFEDAHAAFDTAWQAYLPGCTDDDFREYRYQRDWAAWKYTMHAAATKLPTQSTDGRGRCFCGAEIVTATTARHVIEHRSNAIAA